MVRTRAALSAMVVLLTFGEAKSSETESADKSQYTLFNPTPERLLRDFSPDRPDTTESPFTIDAGHVQVETNLFGYARSRPDLEGTITDTFDVATSNIRTGLTNSAEIDFVLQPYGVMITHPLDRSRAFRSSGVGGLEILAKFNLWGNDTFGAPGSTALALLPFVSLPLDRTNGISPAFVEGGLIVPFGVQLSDKFELELNAGGLYLRDSGAARHHAEFLTSASLAYQWTETFGTYYEVVAQVGRQDPQGDIVLLDSGFTYLLTKNVQLDGGVNFGVTPAAPRINPFVGITARF
jgi:outer membrane putative beta-barrel porin/alpha-amylase